MFRGDRSAPSPERPSWDGHGLRSEGYGTVTRHAPPVEQSLIGGPPFHAAAPGRPTASMRGSGGDYDSPALSVQEQLDQLRGMMASVLGNRGGDGLENRLIQERGRSRDRAMVTDFTVHSRRAQDSEGGRPSRWGEEVSGRSESRGDGGGSGRDTAMSRRARDTHGSNRGGVRESRWEGTRFGRDTEGDHRDEEIHGVNRGGGRASRREEEFARDIEPGRRDDDIHGVNRGGGRFQKRYRTGSEGR